MKAALAANKTKDISVERSRVSGFSSKQGSIPEIVAENTAYSIGSKEVDSVECECVREHCEQH